MYRGGQFVKNIEKIFSKILKQVKKDWLRIAQIIMGCTLFKMKVAH